MQKWITILRDRLLTLSFWSGEQPVTVIYQYACTNQIELNLSFKESKVKQKHELVSELISKVFRNKAILKTWRTTLLNDLNMIERLYENSPCKFNSISTKVMNMSRKDIKEWTSSAKQNGADHIFSNLNEVLSVIFRAIIINFHHKPRMTQLISHNFMESWLKFLLEPWTGCFQSQEEWG